MRSCRRSAIFRSSADISAIFARMSASPAARSSSGVRLADALRSRALSAIAARSSSVHTFFFALGIGRLLSGGLALLEDPDRVAERISDTHVGAVEVVGRFLGEVRDTALLERVVEA